ncbi:Glycosyltransferase 28 domain protein [Methylocella silvestris BL2]|uniref:Glycosyltransferase 28 domain protein n=1 Tax=Methylocella silvestris (strain DSM 15510 / CIP 108128 / LMG 27833 / NCIMB 13906 / BL2) TaxID=395965 RepID=B8EMU9_METSB|nr:nucleotide disphospho-sugar-binding domain-containing protein [Methylocella silvestris]ACK52778.1 Glycosyltransferase 28 domain protein [Methylocella silvestris BL2]
MPYNFLLACWGVAGNLGPMLTAGRQLRRSGHTVRLLADSALREEIEAAGFGFTAWRRAPNYSDFEPLLVALDPTDLGSFSEHILFGPAAACAADTREELNAAPTDALLAHDMLLGSAIAAEAAGVPCAVLSPHISVRPLPGVPHVGSGLTPPRSFEERADVEAANRRFGDALNERLYLLNEAREGQGLAPLNHVFDQYDRPDRFLLAISSAFDFPADDLPDNVRYIGPLLDPPGWSKPWRAPWPAQSDRPRALVSFSTTFQDQADALQRVVNALGRVEIDAVVTTGPALVGSALHAPKNVTLLHSAPHDAVMKEVSLVVTHGGHGTVSRALLHRLPLLIMPMGRDQDDNALRAEARGVGLTLPPTASEAEIARALNRLLTEPHFRIAAHRLGAAIAAELDSAGLVGEMEEIVAFRRADHRPARKRLLRN